METDDWAEAQKITDRVLARKICNAMGMGPYESYNKGCHVEVSHGENSFAVRTAGDFYIREFISRYSGVTEFKITNRLHKWYGKMTTYPDGLVDAEEGSADGRRRSRKTVYDDKRVTIVTIAQALAKVLQTGRPAEPSVFYLEKPFTDDWHFPLQPVDMGPAVTVYRSIRNREMVKKIYDAFSLCRDRRAKLEQFEKAGISERNGSVTVELDGHPVSWTFTWHESGISESGIIDHEADRLVAVTLFPEKEAVRHQYDQFSRNRKTKPVFLGNAGLFETQEEHCWLTRELTPLLPRPAAGRRPSKAIQDILKYS